MYSEINVDWLSKNKEKSEKILLHYSKIEKFRNNGWRWQDDTLILNSAQTVDQQYFKLISSISSTDLSWNET